MSRSLRILLVASLALNLFAAATFAAHAFGHRHFGPAPHQWRPRSGIDLRMLKGQLPNEDQPLAEEALKVHRGEIHHRVGALREARKAAADALRAEPFDRKRLDAALATVRERESALTAAAQGTMAGLAEKVSAAGRQKMAEQMLVRRPMRAPGRDCPAEKAAGKPDKAS